MKDEAYGSRLLISTKADDREIISNIRVAKSILNSFPETIIEINEHLHLIGISNPEYTIDGYLGDRKGILSEKGITAGFKSAKKQSCRIVVIDLDEHVGHVRSFDLSKYISRRKADFVNGTILNCYVVSRGKEVCVTAGRQNRKEIEICLNKLKP